VVIIVTHLCKLCCEKKKLYQTVPALLYNLYCLATNPEIQEKAYQEVHSYLKRDQRITYDIINKFSYLKAVVKETFRYTYIHTYTFHWSNIRPSTGEYETCQEM